MVFREEDGEGDGDNHSLASGSDMNQSWVSAFVKSFSLSEVGYDICSV